MRFILAMLPAAAWAFAADPAIEFNRDIRPILSENCFACHGPDATKRQAKLRLDEEAGAKARAVVPGDAEKSELIRRVRSSDPRLRMPPAYSGAAGLSGRQIELLTRWVAEGAQWQRHWSLIRPARPELPPIGDRQWPKNPVDYFVAAKLEREGLKPSPEAAKRILLRRLSFDLTGLPPTPAELDAFVADTSPGAYEKAVDRLLASPHYGERMASRWLDAARYADTNGYQTDAERSMWRWRDWVIDAFNRNLPYDQFAIQQIAGDLLPGAARDQVIATGFNRNHRGNGEGGIIPEEYAVEYVVDRVDTTATVFLGLTLGCARCHDHKFDPFTQKEFYQFYAYFNRVPERGNAFKYGNSPPAIDAPTPEQEARLNELERKISDARRRIRSLEPRASKEQGKWEDRAKKGPDFDWSPSRGAAVRLDLNGSLEGEIQVDPPRSDRYRYLMENGPAEAPVDFTGRAQWKDGAARYAEGPVGQSADFDGSRYIDAGNVGAFGFYDSFTISAWINPSAASGTIVSRTNDISEGRGYALFLDNGKLSASLVQRWLDDGVRLTSGEAVPLNRWSHVALTYDGSRMASGVQLYLNGRALKTAANLDYLNQPFEVKQPLRIGGGLGKENRFQGRIARVRIYRSAVSPEEAAILAVPESVKEIAGMRAERRSAAQSAKIRACFLEQHAPAEIRDAHKELYALAGQRRVLLESVPTVMVMQDSASRDTHVLVRGAYDRPGEKVEPGVPAALAPLPAGVPNNRLGLARWIVDPANPLTARVAVNRMWQAMFGAGLVRTAEDFGSQGEWPSHPELLDWLATEFIRTGWDTKAIQKTIVMSATYRQASAASPELLRKDPENRLLARGPRVRLPAEMVRDQALAASGLLVQKIGGPSVKPYQPAGLWKELSGGDDYKADSGEGLYRRSLYTYWKRTAPPPMMMNFDAAGRETCVVREHRTNTPLQALNLMNDVTYVEAARKLAGRMMREGGATPDSRIAYGFMLATSRAPREREAEILRSSLAYYRDTFAGDPAAALKLLSHGESPRDPALEARELASYASVASMILNLDAAITKE